MNIVNRLPLFAAVSTPIHVTSEPIHVTGISTPLFTIFFLAGILLSTPLFSQVKYELSYESGDSLTHSGRKSSSAVSCGESIPVIDGILDEDVWRRAAAATGFLQKEPLEGTPATVRTEVRYAYTDRHLYIGAIMYIMNPDAIQSTMSRRDNAGQSERIIVSLDTYHDRRTAYTYGVTASGVRFDYYHAEDAESNRDYSYDPVWEARVSRSDTAWFAEMRIPFSQLRFNDTRQQVWGLQMNRFIPSRNEDVYWVLIPKREPGWSSRFGLLTGIEGIRPSMRIELTPYVVGDATIRSNPDPENPFTGKTDGSYNAGLDLKMGLGPNLTLDATINPDFGQVEADPAVVNLTAFETFFPERRPFFIEGSRLLQGRGPNYYYSRRIGAAPGFRPRGDYVDMPNQTTILGAGKISGRLSTGLSIGAMAAATSREYADIYSMDSETISEVLVEPFTGYGVVRLQQEFGAAASTVGATITGVQRDLRNDATLADFLMDRAFSGGSDWNIRFDGGAYSLNGYLGLSHVEGSSAALLGLQQNSAHYFQRPDQDHVNVDSQRTSLDGYTAMLKFDKNSGEHWTGGIGAAMESPGFELNDVGHLRSADDIDLWGRIRYRENTPGTSYYRYEAVFEASRSYNFWGILRHTSFGSSFQWTWSNYWFTGLWVDAGLRGLNQHKTRGGPLMGTASGVHAYLLQRNNFADNTQWELGLSAYMDELGSQSISPSVELDFTIAERAECSIELGYHYEVDARQYVMTGANGPEATYDRRYIFSFIERGTVYTQLRFNYAFTPDLTLEIYAEPFAASGRYYDFGELTAARSRDLRTYGTDGSTISRDENGDYTITDGNDSFMIHNPDFNVLSYRSNVVLRWEWLRGSTLFFVWQQNRASYSPTGDRIGLRDMLNSYDSPGDNFLALKITYWLPIS